MNRIVANSCVCLPQAAGILCRARPRFNQYAYAILRILNRFRTERLRTMPSKLRISIVEYLNTAPLVWGFTDGPLAGKYDLSFTVPSQCAEALRAARWTSPSFPPSNTSAWTAWPLSPGSRSPRRADVRSLLVVAKRPIEMAKRIALDTSSRSSAALVRLLAAEYWKISPEFVEAAPDPTEMLKQADAALVIGDPALRVALKMDTLAGKAPSGEQCCQGDPDELPVPGFETHLRLRRCLPVARNDRQTLRARPLGRAARRGHARKSSRISKLRSATASRAYAKSPRAPPSSSIFRRSLSSATSPSILIFRSRRGESRGAATLFRKVRRLRD